MKRRALIFIGISWHKVGNKYVKLKKKTERPHDLGELRKKRHPLKMNKPEEAQKHSGGRGQKPEDQDSRPAWAT